MQRDMEFKIEKLSLWAIEEKALFFLKIDGLRDEELEKANGLITFPDDPERAISVVGRTLVEVVDRLYMEIFS